MKMELINYIFSRQDYRNCLEQSYACVLKRAASTINHKLRTCTITCIIGGQV
jgi:hypothetical protein